MRRYDTDTGCVSFFATPGKLRELVEDALELESGALEPQKADTVAADWRWTSAFWEVEFVLIEVPIEHG